jgi:hypothetical protein
VIAFEDIGVGSPAALSAACFACDTTWRQERGTDHDIAIELAKTLARATKSRAAENVWTAACHSPSAAVLRDSVRSAPPEALRAALQNPELPLLVRAIHVSIQQRAALRKPEQWLEPLLSGFASTEATAILAATVSAARITREAFCLLVPHVWTRIRDSGPEITLTSLPPTRSVGDFPVYALDKHTRLGRIAIRRFASANAAVSAVLRSVSGNRRLQAAYMAAFYADAAQLDRKLGDLESQRMEQLALEADLLRSGVPLAFHQSLQAAFAENLEHLNELRAEVYADSQTRSFSQGSQAS